MSGLAGSDSYGSAMSTNSSVISCNGAGKPCVTLERSLMRVVRDGRIIEVVWDPEKRQTLTSRYGMVLWYDFQIFEKDKWFEHPL